MLDWEVDFPLAGYAGPGFHNWPSGHIPQDTASNPLLRIRPHAKKTFGKAFGAATGVSDPRLQKPKPMAMPWAFTGRPVGAGKARFIGRPLPLGLEARHTGGTISKLTRECGRWLSDWATVLSVAILSR